MTTTLIKPDTFVTYRSCEVLFLPSNMIHKNFTSSSLITASPFYCHTGRNNKHVIGKYTYPMVSLTQRHEQNKCSDQPVQFCCLIYIFVARLKIVVQ